MGMMDSGMAGFLQGAVSGMDRARERERQTENDKRQAARAELADQYTRMQMDIAQQNQAMQQAKQAQLADQRKADAWIYQNPQAQGGMMAAAGAGDSWARGFGGGPDLTAASPEAYKWSYEQSNPKPPKLTGMLGNLKALNPDASPQELLGMAMSMSKAGASKTTFNTGDTGSRIVKIDDKKGTAIIEDRTAPNGLRVVQLPGGEIRNETETRARTSGVAGAIAVRELDYVLDLLGYEPETGKQQYESRVLGPRGRTLLDNGIGRALSAGTDTNSFSGTLQSIKDTIAINRLLEIKASGAGLGQVPQSQLEALARALGNLNPDLADNVLARNLTDVRRIYKDVVKRSADDVNDQTFSGVMEATTQPVRGGGNDADAEADRLIQQYGGAR